MQQISNTKTSIDKDKLRNIITRNYVSFAPEYMTFLSEWITETYKTFQDADKFIILIYLCSRNLEFFNQNFIKVDYETLYNIDHIEIKKINIVEISKALAIPKETTRRKVAELQSLGILKKKNKSLIIDQKAFGMVKPINNLKNLTNVFYSIFKICNKENLIKKDVSKDYITQSIKKNFSFTWFHYYKFIFSWLFNWKKFFNNDTELFIIWSIPTIQRAYKMREIKDYDTDINNWRSTYEKIQSQGINTMSLSDITGIPRPTVTRKLKKLIDSKLLSIDKNKLIHPGIFGKYKEEMFQIQNNSLKSFSEFTSIVSNQVIFN